MTMTSYTLDDDTQAFYRACWQDEAIRDGATPFNICYTSTMYTSSHFSGLGQVLLSLYFLGVWVK